MKIILVLVALILLLAGCNEDKARIAELEKTVKEKDADIAKLLAASQKLEKTLQPPTVMDIIEKNAPETGVWKTVSSKPDVPGFNKARLTVAGLVMALQVEKTNKLYALQMLYALEDSWPDYLSDRGKQYKAGFWQCRDAVTLARFALESSLLEAWKPDSIESKGMAKVFGHVFPECQAALANTP